MPNTCSMVILLCDRSRLKMSLSGMVEIVFFMWWNYCRRAGIRTVSQKILLTVEKILAVDVQSRVFVKTAVMRWDKKSTKTVADSFFRHLPQLVLQYSTVSSDQNGLRRKVKVFSRGSVNDANTAGESMRFLMISFSLQSGHFTTRFLIADSAAIMQLV